MRKILVFAVFALAMTVGATSVQARENYHEDNDWSHDSWEENSSWEKDWSNNYHDEEYSHEDEDNYNHEDNDWSNDYEVTYHKVDKEEKKEAKKEYKEERKWEDKLWMNKDHEEDYDSKEWSKDSEDNDYGRHDNDYSWSYKKDDEYDHDYSRDDNEDCDEEHEDNDYNMSHDYDQDDDYNNHHNDYSWSYMPSYHHEDSYNDHSYDHEDKSYEHRKDDKQWNYANNNKWSKAAYKYHKVQHEYPQHNQNQREFSAWLTGKEEVPPVYTDARGMATFHVINNPHSEMIIHYEIKVMNGEDVTAAHIHNNNRGQNGPVVVDLFHSATPVDVNGRLVTGYIMASHLKPDGGVPTLMQLVDMMRRNQLYVNVHTTMHPNGEIRGQIG